MDGQIRKGFQWVTRALALDGSTSPHRLADEIVPNLDVDQSGWGHELTETRPYAWTVPVNTAADTYDLIAGGVTGVAVPVTAAPPPSPDLQYVVHSLTISNVGVTVVGDVWFQYRPAGGLPVVLSRVTAPGDLSDYGGAFPTAFAGSDQFLPNGPVFVPPGYRPQLRIFYPTAVAGETIDVTTCITTMAAGFAGGAP